MRKVTAFTLLEVLLVLGIISVLLALSTTAFISSRKTARDSKRKADMEQLRSSLEMYKADSNAYPGPPLLTYNTAVDLVSLDSFLVSGSNNYISKMPTDPISSMKYSYIPVSTGYYLCAALEGASVPTINCASADCGSFNGSSVPCSYEVKNP